MTLWQRLLKLKEKADRKRLAKRRAKKRQEFYKLVKKVGPLPTTVLVVPGIKFENEEDEETQVTSKT
jgi:hypothetical protein